VQASQQCAAQSQAGSRFLYPLKILLPVLILCIIGPMVGHPQNSMTQAQLQAQQAAAETANTRAKMRSRKPTDKTIPEGVEECIIGDGVQRYRELRELERKLDATMMRKRLDIHDAVNRNVKVVLTGSTYTSSLTFA